MSSFSSRLEDNQKQRIAAANVRSVLSGSLIDPNTGGVVITINTQRDYDALVESVKHLGFVPAHKKIVKDENGAHGGDTITQRKDGDVRPVGVCKTIPETEENQGFIPMEKRRDEIISPSNFPAEVELDSNIVQKYHPQLQGHRSVPLYS